jgi:galactokinase
MEKEMTEAKTFKAFAPGRTTLNDHVDYWHGIGIGIALKTGTTVTFTPDKKSEKVFITDKRVSGAFIRDVNEKRTEEKEKIWTNYIVGVFNYLKEFGLNTGGGKIEIDSQLPMGGGVSSSAALIVATMSATLKPYFTEGELDNKQADYLLSKDKIKDLVDKVLTNVGDDLDEKHHTQGTKEYSNLLRKNFADMDAKTGLNYIVALLSHRVETEYVGASCGRLDQMSCALAEPGQAIKINFDDLSFERLPKLPDGHDIIVVNSGQKHALVDPESPYRKRFDAPRDEIMPFLGISSILQVKDENYAAEREKVEGRFGKIYADWFEHAYKESKRGEQQADAIKAGDVKTLAKLMNDSHTSLSGIYANSTTLIDNMVKEVTGPDGPALAARITGGGGGGYVVMLVESPKAVETCRKVEAFRRRPIAAIPGEPETKGIDFVETPQGVLKAAGISAGSQLAA